MNTQDVDPGLAAGRGRGRIERGSWPASAPAGSAGTWSTRFPRQDTADRSIGDAVLAELRQFLTTRVDPDEIDVCGSLPDGLLDELRSRGYLALRMDAEAGRARPLRRQRLPRHRGRHELVGAGRLVPGHPERPGRRRLPAAAPRRSAARPDRSAGSGRSRLQRRGHRAQRCVERAPEHDRDPYRRRLRLRDRRREDLHRERPRRGLPGRLRHRGRRRRRARRVLLPRHLESRLQRQVRAGVHGPEGRQNRRADVRPRPRSPGAHAQPRPRTSTPSSRSTGPRACTSSPRRRSPSPSSARTGRASSSTGAPSTGCRSASTTRSSASSPRRWPTPSPSRASWSGACWGSRARARTISGWSRARPRTSPR